MALLSDSEIEARLAELAGWRREGGSVVKSFDRGDFVGSVGFVESLVEPAEAMSHHPDLEISWSEVKVTISTHSEGGLTALDFELAAKIDARS
jgi:4a-hydroxytetrahydrobiopterin dehydratase